MLLNEIIEKLGNSKKIQHKDANLPEIGLGNLSAKEALEIIDVAIETQAIEELITCLADMEMFSGSRYRDIIKNSENLGFGANELRTIEGFKQKAGVSFFINSLGPHLDNSAEVYFASRRFKEAGMTSDADRDFFSSYYRTSTGTALALGRFFDHLNKDPKYNIASEILKIALGAKDVLSTVMPNHFSYTKIGHLPETGVTAGLFGHAVNTAVANSWLYRDSKMALSESSAVHIYMGDGGMNEASVLTAIDRLENHFYLLAKNLLKLTDGEVKRARTDSSFRESIYQRLRESRETKINLALTVYNNQVAISCRPEQVYPFGNSAKNLNRMQQEGMVEPFEYDGRSLTEILLNASRIEDNLRNGVMSAGIVHVSRPGGHSRSNFYGLGVISQDQKKSPLRTLTIEEARYHNNNDPVLNALDYLISEGYIGPKDAINQIEEAQKRVIHSLLEVISGYHKKTSIDVTPSLAYSPKNSQQKWDKLTARESLDKRLAFWKGDSSKGIVGHMKYLSNFKPLGIKGEINLPEEMETVSPAQATIFSLADIAMMCDSRLVYSGEDVVIGGINNLTYGLRDLLERINPRAGNRVFDSGINELGILQISGFKRAFGERSFVVGEIQFRDYLEGMLELKTLCSNYKRSAGKDALPMAIMMNCGFIRGEIDKVFSNQGPSGINHSGLEIGELINAYSANIVMPNTSRAVQMAWRNAYSSDDVTFIMLSEPVIKKIRMGSFNYDDRYLSMDEPLDPLGTSYWYFQKDGGKNLPLSAHNEVILTYGEYVPVCHMVAENLAKQGINALVVDYSTLMPHDRELTKKILNGYSGSGKLPNFTIVSQENVAGFGSIVLNDLAEEAQGTEGIKIQHLHRTLTINEWKGERFIYQTPNEIYNKIIGRYGISNPDSLKGKMDVSGAHNPIIR